MPGPSCSFKKLLQIERTEVKSVPGQNQDKIKYLTTRLKLKGLEEAICILN